VGLVLQSAALGVGGEIFTLDMGNPVKIVDLARQLITLSGFTPDKDIRIEFTGLRPGEKLFEELSYKGEHISATQHPKIMRLLCTPPPLQWIRGLLLDLVGLTDNVDPDQFKWLLKRAVPEYQPQLKGSAIAMTFVKGAIPQVNGHKQGSHDECLPWIHLPRTLNETGDKEEVHT
jgi:FlaA1/EpsC-like NDP-sugar epimerase